MSIWFSKKMSWLSWLMILILLLNSIGVSADLFRKTPQPARATDPNMIAFWDTGSGTIPTGWTCISDGVGEDFYQRYVRASGTYGAQGGAATHTHTLTYVSEAPVGAPVINANRTSGAFAAPAIHPHGSLANSSITPDSNSPAYNSLKILEYDSGTPTILPSGIILLTETAITLADWQLYSAQDGRFILGDATTATGGDSNPTHTVASGLGATIGVAAVATGAGALATMTHGHSAGAGVATNNPSIEPPYREMVFQQTTTATTLHDGVIAGFTGTGVSASWTVVSASGGNYYQRFIKSKQSGIGLISSGSSIHSHADVTVTTGSPDATVNRDISLARQALATDTHTHTVTISLQADVDHTPLYTDLVLAQYAAVYTPKINNWRWYGDEADTAVDTSYAVENTAPPQEEMGKSIAMKLRINLTEIDGVAENDSRKILQYSTSTGGPWTGVEAIGATLIGTKWRFYNGGGTDGATLPSKVLSDSSAVSLGTHNEANTTGQTNSDHPASTTVEWEFCLENYNASANTIYYFNIKDEVLNADIPLGSGKSYPSLTTAAAYTLTINAPSAVYLGSWVLGSSAYASYDFVGGEEITVRDNRGVTSGNSAGWSCTAAVTSELTYTVGGTWTITDDNTWWISDTIIGLYAAPITNIATQSGSYMGSPVTVASVSGNVKDGLGGFTLLPTLWLYNVPHIGDYAGQITVTLI